MANPILMDNHQAELADKLDRMRHLFAATTASLVEVVEGMDVLKLVPYAKGDPSGIALSIEKLLG